MRLLIVSFFIALFAMVRVEIFRKYGPLKVRFQKFVYWLKVRFQKIEE